jgi:hypothetical protein
MSISSLHTSPKPSSPLSTGDTSSVIKDVLGDRSDQPKPMKRRDFKDTLARLSAKHEAREEDNPESDTAYQALLKPIQIEQELAHPAHHDFIKLSQRFAMPERPKTSPSKLALSVELKPITDQDDLLTQARQRARLKLLAPLDDDTDESSSFLGQASPEFSLKTPDSLSSSHIEPIAKFTERNADSDIKPKPKLHAAPQQDPDDIEPSAPDSSIDPAPFSRAQSPQASPALKALPMPPALISPEVLPQPAPLEQATSAAPAAHAEHTSGALLPDAVERTQLARRVALSMENSPLGQKLEIDIKDIFGQPLTLKIIFEDQRARATCFGSQFHDPAQMEHVLDSVRTALEASGFELGDFIMHHHRDRRPQGDAPGEGAQGGEEAEEQKPARREILRIVGIVNRIA